MRKCKSELELSDFDTRRFYIQKEIKSFSNLNTISNSTSSGEVTQWMHDDDYLVRRNIKIVIGDEDTEPDPELFGISSGSSSSTNSIADEWNVHDDIPPSSKKENGSSFVELFYSSPKSFSTGLSRIINNLFENPEGRMTNLQRTSIILFTCFEVYRTLISSFLIVFVPQNCGGFSCTIYQNLIPTDNLEIAAVSVNTFMATYFFALFTIESLRETTVKKYLISDKSSATDKESLTNMLSSMKPHQRQKIIWFNRVYRAFAQYLLLMFFVNAIISCLVIKKNYLNNTTATVFITNTFFMINRIHKALKITSSGEYNIYSAYRTDSLLYNRYRGGWLQNDLPT